MATMARSATPTALLFKICRASTLAAAPSRLLTTSSVISSVALSTQLTTTTSARGSVPAPVERCLCPSVAATTPATVVQQVVTEVGKAAATAISTLPACWIPSTTPIAEAAVACRVHSRRPATPCPCQTRAPSTTFKTSTGSSSNSSRP
ncbi:hypothetical protein LTR53_019364, partial [Teratosphaeriaceae sp. CCFEE 6253]